MNTVSIVDLAALKPHWDSGYTLSASSWSLLRITLAKAFPTMLRREIRWALTFPPSI